MKGLLARERRTSEPSPSLLLVGGYRTPQLHDQNDNDDNDKGDVQLKEKGKELVLKNAQSEKWKDIAPESYPNDKSQRLILKGG